MSGERNVPETQKSESRCYVAPQEVNNKKKIVRISDME